MRDCYGVQRGPKPEIVEQREKKHIISMKNIPLPEASFEWLCRLRVLLTCSTGLLWSTEVGGQNLPKSLSSGGKNIPFQYKKYYPGGFFRRQNEGYYHDMRSSSDVPDRRIPWSKIPAAVQKYLLRIVWQTDRHCCARKCARGYSRTYIVKCVGRRDGQKGQVSCGPFTIDDKALYIIAPSNYNRL